MSKFLWPFKLKTPPGGWRKKVNTSSRVSLPSCCLPFSLRFYDVWCYTCDTSCQSKWCELLCSFIYFLFGNLPSEITFFDCFRCSGEQLMSFDQSRITATLKVALLSRLYSILWWFNDWVIPLIPEWIYDPYDLWIYMRQIHMIIFLQGGKEVEKEVPVHRIR